MKTKAWEKLTEKLVKVGYKTAIFKKFKMPDGLVTEYTTWGRPKGRCIGTIALTKDLKIIIARQFRPGPEKIFDG